MAGRGKRVSLADIALMLFFVILCGVMLYPFWNTIMISLMKPAEAGSMDLKLIVREPTLAAYRYALKSSSIAVGYRNTILRSSIMMAAGAFLTFCAAYPLSKRQLPGRNTLTLFLIIPMFFSGGLIPSFILINNLKIFDTFWALILPGLISTYNILITRNFVMAIPESMEESAMLDGASFPRILLSIILPLSTPILATIALWIAVGAWNEWFGAMVYTRKGSLQVLQLILRKMTIARTNELDDLLGNEAILSKSIEAATILVSVGPIILIYPFFQKYFVKGVMVGSLKG